ncbi:MULTISPECIES: PepSY domain-containing protein [unclassified Streptomyces]|uniref:PepSY domain-containing protein n=1 Tax=unclassified Streptomyces TaxID=2593676 RepID=UPI002DDAB843|nr:MULTISPECIES: PepSY domain-containing protein [unclassified Streptomyces]WSA79149.1 PepSY domain-containing protein [Streptomyces sp. NBC_01799]WSF84414.1 PepSY domain-containing protein [Streptomyces sp. NBC_01744]WSA70652.1 PepSY domain-containing protein [Streptomyces sp. NBC_01800]WSC39300.1 PepSY domain-containing protein [Streptomyces sp. NBC_01763]WSC47437.1 PepSY domain-containing protein [Streptomyces sp. NBC_01762]
MKRRIAIAAVTAAVLVGGGTATAVAFGDDNGRDSHDSAKVLSRHTSDDNNDDDTAHRTPRSASVTLSAAMDAALRSVPGTVTSIELDDADRSGEAQHWEVEINGKDGTHHELNVDARTAEVTPDHSDDGHHGGDRHDDRDDD